MLRCVRMGQEGKVLSGGRLDDERKRAGMRGRKQTELDDEQCLLALISVLHAFSDESKGSEEKEHNKEQSSVIILRKEVGH
jgi:hypothetical protein